MVNDFSSLAFLILGLVIVVLIIFIKPHLSILAPIYGVMFSLPISILFGNLSLVTLGLQLIGIVSSMVLLLKAGTNRLVAPIVSSLIILLFICVLGYLIGIQRVEQIVQLQAIKILILPIMLSIGCINPKFNWKNSLKILIAILGIENFFAIIQYRLGVSYLISIGLEYGSELRQIEGQLRPPALFLNHFEYGLFSAAIFVACIGYKKYSSLGNERWVKYGFFISGLGVVLSTARTAILIALVAYVLSSQLDNSRSKILKGKVAKSINALGLAFIITLIFPSLAASARFYSRFDNWQLILIKFNIFFGNGIGSAGGATSSNFYREESKVIVDNYLLSILAQVGVIGLVLFLICLFGLVKGQIKHKFVVIAITFSFLTLESWEYFAPMSILLIAQFQVAMYQQNLKT
jgi:hypothetical protein